MNLDDSETIKGVLGELIYLVKKYRDNKIKK